jgi:6-pyruvoyltetrahydropterin/6-carboxytetrahydropterin synthase
MMRLTRRYRFAASHRLHVPQFTDEENQRLFGKCNNPFGHGHDYLVEVTVAGPVNEKTGLLIDIPALDALVENKVLQRVRMKYLNEQVPEFEQVTATTENLAEQIRVWLKGAWEETFANSRVALDRVGIIETRKNVFETRCI